MDPKNIDAYQYKCAGLLQMMKFDKAVKCYSELLEIDPNNKSGREGKKEAEARLADSKSGERVPVNRMACTDGRSR